MSLSVLNLATEYRRHTYPRSKQWKRQRLGSFAQIVQKTMEMKIDLKRPTLGSFTTIMKIIFGPSGGKAQCRGIRLEIADGSLTTATKEACLQICNCKEEVAPLKNTEQFVSSLVAMGPIQNPLRAPAKLYIPLENDMYTDHELVLRWSPSQVGEPTKWRDVLPGTCKGHLAGPAARLEILSDQQAKISTNRLGLFCIIARETSKTYVEEKDNDDLNTSGFLIQGISGIIRRLSQKAKSETSEELNPDKEESERIPLLR